MKVIISSKNVKTSDHLKSTVEKKLEKLNRYFLDDITANVMISEQRDKQKLEVTISAGGTLFRAENTADVAYDAIEGVVEKLSTQMSRFKKKLQKKHKDAKVVIFDELPEYDEEESDAMQIARRKDVELAPMNEDEAIMQMELLGHSFFIFLNMENDAISVVYKRKNGDYGIINVAK
ncbi:MAG: ribosome hibernation-promoting factor, HPF/YfiA family [Eubacteriales bacterium]